MIQEAAENCLQANMTCTPADTAPTSQLNLCRALLKTRKRSSRRNLLKFKVQCKSTWKRSGLIPTYTRRQESDGEIGSFKLGSGTFSKINFMMSTSIQSISHMPATTFPA